MSKILFCTIIYLLIISPLFAAERERPLTGKFSLMPRIGTDFTVGGTFVKAGKIDSIEIDATTVTLISSNSHDFDDVYHMPVSTGLSLNYGLTDFTEAFVSLEYLKAKSKKFDGAAAGGEGAMFGDITLDPFSTITAEFDDYHETSLNVGARHFFNRFHSLSPFVSVEGGVKYTEKVELELSSATDVIRDISFYEESWAPNFGMGAGLLLEVKDYISFMVETGLHYDFELKEDDTSWRGGGDYEDVNNGGERWSIPLMFSLRISL